MTFDEAMAALEKAGSEQTRKTWARHGFAEPYFGVKFGDLKPLAKKIKLDQPLAKALWKTGNADARNLAMLIADPSLATKADLDSWAKGLNCYGHADAVAKVAANSAHADQLLLDWTSAKAEWVERAGWHILSVLAAKPERPDAFFEPWLKQITSNIHTAKNFVRDSMNTALIAIGGRSEALRAKAETAAKKIGVVNVDWGDTNCKTPDAAEYIGKIWAHKQGRATRAPMLVPAAKKPKKK